MIARLITATAFLVTCFLSPPLVRGADKIDDIREVAGAYDKAAALLQKSDFVGASVAFRDLISRNPQSKNLDVFLYNAGRADYHRGQFVDAAATFEKLLGQFPESELRAFGEYFLGSARYGLADAQGALAAWVASWRDCKDDRLGKLVVSSLAGSLNAASDVKLNRAMFALLGDDQLCELSRRILALVPATKPQVRNELNSLCGAGGAPTKTQPSPGRGPKAEYQVALLLPFSGGYSAFSQQIAQGATVASEEIAAQAGVVFTLVPHDTKGDPITAARLLKSIDSSKALAAIGPLTSEEAGVVSAALNSSRLPLLIPAATDAGLTTLSATSFQMSANIELQGTSMADYARSVLKADSAAIFMSGESNYFSMADAFTRRFERSGGKVVASEYYVARDRDYGPYLNDLKALILGYKADSIFYINARGDTLDPEGVPVHVDCVFMPGEAAQLRQILPQMRFYGIDASLLGSDSWNDTLVFAMGEEVTRQAVFPSPFILHENTEQFVAFSAAYVQRFGAKPTRLACLGYDAVKLVADAVAAQATDRASLLKHLSLRPEFEGAAGTISFGNNRENIEMPLYRVQGGKAVPLKTGNSAPGR